MDFRRIRSAVCGFTEIRKNVCVSARSYAKMVRAVRRIKCEPADTHCLLEIQTENYA